MESNLFCLAGNNIFLRKTRKGICLARRNKKFIHMEPNAENNIFLRKTRKGICLARNKKFTKEQQKKKACQIVCNLTITQT